MPGGFFHYDLNKMLFGRISMYIAPITATLPTRIADVVAQVGVSGEYAPVGDWDYAGATSGPSQYTTGKTTTSVDIQQTSSALFEEIDEVNRQIACPFAEITPELFQRLEESPSIDTITATANKSAEKQVPFGSITEFTEYRLALLARFKESQVTVEEPGGVVRGGMVGFIAHRVTMAAENTQVSFGEGELVSVPMTFNILNDSAVTAAGEESGYWVWEQAGTISAT